MTPTAVMLKLVSFGEKKSEQNCGNAKHVKLLGGFWNL